AAAFFLAFALRFEGWKVPPHYARVLLQALPLVLFVEFACLVAFGVPRRSWRFAGLWEGQRLFCAPGLATVLLVGWRPAVHPSPGLLLPEGGPSVPFGVLLANLPLAFLGLACLRGGVRLWVERPGRGRRRGAAAVPTLLIGAGRAGALVAREIALRPDTGI